MTEPEPSSPVPALSTLASQTQQPEAQPPEAQPPQGQAPQVQALRSEPAPDDLTEHRRVRRTMRLSLLEGSVTQVFLNWTTGSVLTGYMLHLGATPAQLGMVASVPLLAQAISPFAAWLAGRLGRRKPLTVVIAFASRLLWVLAALIPTLGLPGPLQVPAMLLLVLLSSVFLAANGSLWASWMSDVVPERERGRYFGLRTGIVGVVGMVGNLAAGVLLDRLAAPLNFQVVLLVAVATSVVGVLLYLLHHEPDVRPRALDLRTTFSSPWREPNFRRFLMFAVYWQASVMLAAPFVFPYFIGELRMTFTQIGVWSAIASVCALVTAFLWGRAADVAGNKSVLSVGTFIAGFALPLSWILAGLTGRMEIIWINAAIDAVAWGAIGPALFNLALGSAPREERTAFYAMFSLATGVAGFTGGLLSGPLLGVLQQFQFEVLGATWTGYHSLFALSGLMRMQAWLLLRPVQEGHAWGTRELLRSLLHWRRFTLKP